MGATAEGTNLRVIAGGRNSIERTALELVITALILQLEVTASELERVWQDHIAGPEPNSAVVASRMMIARIEGEGFLSGGTTH